MWQLPSTARELRQQVSLPPGRVSLQVRPLVGVLRFRGSTEVLLLQTDTVGS